MEHSSPSIETIANMALLARALNFPIVVRPPKANREWITRLLDLGVWNLHCPQVGNARHASEIVAASRYAPRGLRGNAGHSPGTDYDATGTAAERRAFANDQVFVTVMFETAAALDDLDDIAAMDGIDAHDRAVGSGAGPGRVRLARPGARAGGETEPGAGRRQEARQDVRDALFQPRAGAAMESGRRAAARLFQRQRPARCIRPGDRPDQRLAGRDATPAGTCLVPVPELRTIASISW